MTETKPAGAEYRRLALPTSVIVSIAAVFVTIVVAFVVLAVTNSDATEFRAWLNTVFNIASIVLGGSGVAFAASADRKAGKAAEQTNGGLDARIHSVVQTAIRSTVPLDSASVTKANEGS